MTVGAGDPEGSGGRPGFRALARWGAIALAGLSAGCGGQTERAAVGESRAIPVVDLHVDLSYGVSNQIARAMSDDLPWRVDGWLATNAASPERLRRGGVALIVVPLFVGVTDSMSRAEVRRAYEEAYSDLGRAWQSSGTLLPPGRAAGPGQVATVLAFEGADGFEDDPAAIDGWIGRGACLFGIVHAQTNRLAGSSQDPERARRAVGLTEAGEAIVRRVIAKGALVDVAHASDAAFDDVARIAREARAPIVDSHTGVRALVDIERNIDDARLRVIAASGGVVGIDLHSGHVSSRAGDAATLADVADHLEHAVKVAGIEHVAIGSDLEGGIEPPIDADGEATWPRLAAVLRERGWSDDRIEAVFSGNARRVLALRCGSPP